MKREKFDFLADNPLYTKRFAFYVGRRCRTATILDIARDLRLDWHTVKALEKQYRRRSRAGGQTWDHGPSASTRSRSAGATPTALW